MTAENLLDWRCRETKLNPICEPNALQVNGGHSRVVNLHKFKIIRIVKTGIYFIT